MFWTTPSAAGSYIFVIIMILPHISHIVAGSSEVLPKHGKRIRPGKIILNISTPVDPHDKDVNTLMEEVYNSIKLGYTF